MSELIIRADAENAYQAGYEEGFNDGYQQAMSERPKIILCKYCKNRYTSKCPFYMMQIATADDWFCADGDRAET